MRLLTCMHFALMVSPSTANLREDIPLPALTNLSLFSKRAELPQCLAVSARVHIHYSLVLRENHFCMYIQESKIVIQWNLLWWTLPPEDNLYVKDNGYGTDIGITLVLTVVIRTSHLRTASK